MRKQKWKKHLTALMVVFLLMAVVIMYTNFSIQAEVDKQTIVVTNKDIPPRTEITEKMLTTISVPSVGIPTNAVREKSDVIGKYTVAGFGISKNSFIYSNKIVKKEQLPDSGILNLKKGEVAVPLLVDLETSLGNSIVPQSHVDLYFRSMTKDDDKEKAIYGKLASQIRVVAVKDADATNVFDDEGYKKEQVNEAEKSADQNLAKIYIFAVPESLNELIGKGKLLGEVIPIATDRTYQLDTKATSETNEVVQYIEKASLSSVVDVVSNTAKENEVNKTE